MRESDIYSYCGVNAIMRLCDYAKFDLSHHRHIGSSPHIYSIFTLFLLDYEPITGIIKDDQIYE